MFVVWVVSDKLLVFGCDRQKPFVCLCLLLKSKDICSLFLSLLAAQSSTQQKPGVVAHKLAWDVLEALQFCRKGTEEQSQDRLCYGTIFTQCY